MESGREEAAAQAGGEVAQIFRAPAVDGFGALMDALAPARIGIVGPPIRVKRGGLPRPLRPGQLRSKAAALAVQTGVIALNRVGPAFRLFRGK